MLCLMIRQSGYLNEFLSIYPKARLWVTQTENTVNASLISVSHQHSVPSARTMLEVAGHVDTWLQQEITNFQVIEIYCCELTERFEDVWRVSGALTLPQTKGDRKKTVTYQVIGEDNVAVPSHLNKVILAHRSPESTEPLALAAFVVPSEAIGFQPQLTEFQVSLQDLEELSGLVFFPQLDRTSNIRNMCAVNNCKLLDFQKFTLYLNTRRIEGAYSLQRLEKVMENLKDTGVEPNDYFLSCYEKKLKELKAKEQSETQKESYPSYLRR